MKGKDGLTIPSKTLQQNGVAKKRPDHHAMATRFLPVRHAMQAPKASRLGSLGHFVMPWEGPGVKGYSQSLLSHWPMASTPSFDERCQLYKHLFTIARRPLSVEPAARNGKQLARCKMQRPPQRCSAALQGTHDPPRWCFAGRRHI